VQQQYQCPQCDAPTTFGSRFCANCGLQLNWTIQQQAQPPPQYRRYPYQQRPHLHYSIQRTAPMKAITGTVVIAIIALIAGFVPIIEVHAYEPLAYDAKSDVYVQQWTVAPMMGVRNEPTCYVTIKNTDNIQGKFRVQITFYYGGEKYMKEFILQLEPGQVKKVEMTSDDIPKDFTNQDGSRSNKDFWKSFHAGDWAADYQVIPDAKVIQRKITIFEYLRSEF